jgi:hypothetical protein
MTTKERLTLSAYQKFVQHGRFPWKFTMHVLLLIASTAQIMLWNFEDGGYYRATNRNWQYWFLYRPSYDSACDLYTYDEVVQSINATVLNFYNIDDLSVDSYRTHVWTSNVPGPAPEVTSGHSSTTSSSIYYNAPLHNVDNLPLWNTTSNGNASQRHAPVLEYTYYTDPASLFNYNVKAPSLATTTQRYLVNGSYFGPFDVNTLGYNGAVENINRLQTATLTLHLDSFLFGAIYRSCLEWIVSITWDFRDRGQVVQRVDSYVAGSCNVQTWGDAWSYELLWLNIPIIILSFVYFILSVKAVHRSVQIFMTIKRRQRSMDKDGSRNFQSRRWKGPPVTWQTLSLSDKCQFFNVWFVLTILGTVCLFVVSWINFINVKSHSPTEDGTLQHNIFCNQLLSNMFCCCGLWYALFYRL